MEEYCVHDTLLLEKVYMKIRAWSTRHPNLDTIIGGYSMRCTVCGSTKMHEVDKDTCTDASRFPTYRCEGCGHVMRGRKRYKPERPVEERLAR
jgi:hypothetical protein